MVYPTAPVAGRDFTLTEELTSGMGIITATLSTDCLSPGQPLGVDVGWGAIAPPGQDFGMRLRLASRAGTAELEQTFPLSDDWRTGDWPVNTVTRGYYRLDIASSLPGDVYRVWLTLVDPETGAALGREVSLGRVTVSEDRCAAFIPVAGTSVNALLGSDLRLMGYQLRREEDQDLPPVLTVTLLWRSERLMNTDYKVSVEVLDVDTGRRVARDDSMPLRWAYRTSYWNKGEVVADAIPLSLEKVPAGLYNVAVTVYDPETGERLPVMDSNGQLQPNAQILLPDQDGAKSERLEVEVGVPEQPPDLAALNIPRSLQIGLIPQLRLLGYDLKHRALLAGDRVTVQLFWEALGSMSEDYEVRLALVDHNGVTHSQQDFSVVSIDYSTTEWRPGDVLEDWYTLPTADDTPSGDVVLTLNLVDEEGNTVLADPLEIDTVWIQAIGPRFEIPDGVDSRDAVSLEDKVALLGYDVSPSVKAGESAALTLYWQAQREMDTSYKVFVHLYDDESGILTQRDRVPGLGARPTSDWQKGEVLADRYYLPIGPDVSAGKYQLAVGLYDPKTGERLVAFGSDGKQLAEGRIPLARVRVEP